MKIDFSLTRPLLKNFDFNPLFIEVLGWERHAQNLTVKIKETEFDLRGIAHKRGIVAFICFPDSNGNIPPSATRKMIEKQVSKTVFEHLIIFTDKNRTSQVWQWVKRETGKPLAVREHTFRNYQNGDSLIQKLETLAFSLEEEEGITQVDVLHRVRSGFDVDRITKRFYERFKKEHDAFLKQIGNVFEETDREWYASIMLNRLMFAYFIQKKGFLDGDTEYLRNRLKMVKEKKGEDKFVNFYRHFLLRLFHEGLGKKKNKRSKDLDALLGEIPYLNGGIFQEHDLEKVYKEIAIPDSAFERLFDFFDSYSWHLDDRPIRNDNEINPDVLGYIFEKYINQKQMGAYYTKEDITEYISKNTVIPRLFDLVREKLSANGSQSVGATRWVAQKWNDLFDLLRNDPDRYFYDSVKKGVEKPLPPEIEVGIADVAKRTEWNKPAPEEYALPTEIWREVVARRQRYSEVKKKIETGEITAINDLITYNLNIRQFAQDVVERTDDVDLVRAFWRCMAGRIPLKSNERFEDGMSILDPTCGSGAFLFAALNILFPLYQACIERMDGYLGDSQRGHGCPSVARAMDGGSDRDSQRAGSDRNTEFEAILKKIDEHPNQTYFILKSIIVNNLFGVDIMEEAIEICKLRLFLKLVSQIEDVKQIEPLPDIDFNIRAGNTLVGFASKKEVEEILSKDLLAFSTTLPEIIKKAEDIDQIFSAFRRCQIEGEGSVPVEHKLELRKRLSELAGQLNGYLAEKYGVRTDRESEYSKWKKSHLPFHWFIEFYGIMNRGGFDVIIGNPPYVEYSKIKRIYSLPIQYQPFSTNLFSACSFRENTIKNEKGYSSLIVPVSFPSTDRMEPLRLVLTKKHSVYFVSFSTRPSKLFEDAEQRLAIYFQTPVKDEKLFSGGYQKWYKEERKTLFEMVEFTEVLPFLERNHIWPKLKGKVALNIFQKLLKFKPLLKTEMLDGKGCLFYNNTGLRYFNTVTLRQPKCWINGVETSSSRETTLQVLPKFIGFIHCSLLSSLFFFWWEATSNCRDLNPSDIRWFPVPTNEINLQEFNTLSQEVEKDYVSKGKIIEMNNKLTGLVRLESLTPARSKGIIDQIELKLGNYYGFSNEELDYICNYDIKFRMGKSHEESEEESE